MCRPCRTMSSPTLTMAVISSGGHDAHEAGEHPGGPDAAAQGHQHAASIGAPVGRAVRRPLVPSPPAMPARIPSDRHATVVSVLREAARVNGDVEAYVEPAGAASAAR